MGSAMVHLEPDSFFNRELWSRAEPYSQQVTFWTHGGMKPRRMKPRRCHQNALLIHQQGRRRYQIVTGYACAPEPEYGEANWRHHTWILDTKLNVIIETTLRRQLYFGTQLRSPDELMTFEPEYASL